MARSLEIDENSEVTLITENCDITPTRLTASIGETSLSKRISPTQISTIKSSVNHMDLNTISSPVSYQSALDYTSENVSVSPKANVSFNKISADSGTKRRDSIVRGFLGNHLARIMYEIFVTMTGLTF